MSRSYPEYEQVAKPPVQKGFKIDLPDDDMVVENQAEILNRVML